jgi:hypothetical protein
MKMVKESNIKSFFLKVAGEDRVRTEEKEGLEGPLLI